jgi:hypothetical protein
MKSKKKRYLEITIAVVVVLVLIVTGWVLSKKRLESRRENMKNQAYIAYVLLNDEVMLATQRTQLDDIKADEIITEYAVGTNSEDESDNVYITAVINAETEDYYIEAFNFYDEDIKTAFIYNSESDEMETISTERNKKYITDKSEITIKE